MMVTANANATAAKATSRRSRGRPAGSPISRRSAAPPGRGGAPAARLSAPGPNSATNAFSCSAASCQPVAAPGGVG